MKYTEPAVLVSAAAEPEIHSEITSAAEAAAYMQQVALKLRNWRGSLDTTAGDRPAGDRPGESRPVENRPADSRPAPKRSTSSARDTKR